MTDITHLDRQALPSANSLIKATAVALAIATVVLVTAVLPAEYGIDPTGLGSRLGLTALSGPAATVASPTAEAATAETATTTASPPATTVASDYSLAAAAPVSVLEAAWKAPAAFRSDELTLTLAPGEGAEIKALMKTGERLVFAWKAQGGPVNFDMHGEKINAAKDEFSSYWKGRDATTGNGAFEAPFDGTHGWFWRNRGTQPVTVTVKTSGFYEKLFRP
ncbi:MAG: hypothetical protein K0Q68_1159 [Moraxellaceae bacterium]|jgi:hypothetical protein|nr:hypothetical protein [Moraxellaceae bacterium]